jgi:hypothetical protein
MNYKNSTSSGVETYKPAFSADETADIGIKCLRHLVNAIIDSAPSALPTSGVIQMLPLRGFKNKFDLPNPISKYMSLS